MSERSRWYLTEPAELSGSDGEAAHSNGPGPRAVAFHAVARDSNVDTSFRRLLPGRMSADRIHPIASASPDIPDVTVTAPRPPTDQELAGDSLAQFVAHHATVHYVNTGVTGNLAHWRGGRQSICPLTRGLDPGYNAFVTARLRALAAYVGAPVQSDLQCKDNVQILFTTGPQETMNDVVKWAAQ
jgi:hypothetical protein